MYATASHLAPVISNARYAKGKRAVHCPSDTGFKSRAACLAEALGGSYSRREHAYILSPSRAASLLAFWESSADASYFNRSIDLPGDQASLLAWTPAGHISNAAGLRLAVWRTRVHGVLCYSQSSDPSHQITPDAGAKLWTTPAALADQHACTYHPATQ